MSKTLRRELTTLPALAKAAFAALCGDDKVAQRNAMKALRAHVGTSFDEKLARLVYVAALQRFSTTKPEYKASGPWAYQAWDALNKRVPLGLKAANLYKVRVAPLIDELVKSGRAKATEDKTAEESALAILEAEPFQVTALELARLAKAGLLVKGGFVKGSGYKWGIPGLSTYDGPEKSFGANLTTENWDDI